MTVPCADTRPAARVAPLLIGTASLLAMLPALAVPLPAPVVDGTTVFNIFDPGARITTFGLLDHGMDGVGTLQFFSAASPSPALRAVADIGPTVNLSTRSGSSSGFLRYSLEITGPDCVGLDGCVPVDITAAGRVTGTATGGGGFEATARWSLRNASEITLLGDALQLSFDGIGGAFTDDDLFDADHSIMLHTNREYRVVMEVLVRASTGINAVGSGDAVAFVDPVFRFGGGFDATPFAFRFSEGIGNELPPGVVPAPGGLALSVLAGAMLFAPRRKRLAT